jgi:hypothetical protein
MAEAMEPTTAAEAETGETAEAEAES